MKSAAVAASALWRSASERKKRCPDCVVRRGRSRRKAADATVDFSADEPPGSEQFLRKRKMRAEIIVPVEARAWGGGIHHAEPDHGEEDNIPGKKTI